MKPLFLFFASFFVGCIALAQELPFNQWTDEEKIQANTAVNVDYLSEEEKNVIYFINLARINPALFAKTYLTQHVKENGLKSDNYYVRTLYEDLRKAKSISPLKPNSNLSKAAKFHALDMGSKGTIGHNSSDGTNTFDRIRRFAKGDMMAENCSYGADNFKGIAVVLQLLIDEGVPSLGHRKTILSEDYSAVGVAIAEHKMYSFNCVLDYSDIVD